MESPPGFTSYDTSNERMENVPRMKPLGKRAKTGRTKRTHTTQIKPAEEYESAIFKGLKARGRRTKRAKKSRSRK